MVFINLSTNVSDHLHSHTKAINTVDSYVSVSPDHEYEDDNQHSISNSNHHTLLPSQMCIQLTYTLPTGDLSCSDFSACFWFTGSNEIKGSLCNSGCSARVCDTSCCCCFKCSFWFHFSLLWYLHFNSLIFSKTLAVGGRIFGFSSRHDTISDLISFAFSFSLSIYFWHLSTSVKNTDLFKFSSKRLTGKSTGHSWEITKRPGLHCHKKRCQNSPLMPLAA